MKSFISVLFKHKIILVLSIIALVIAIGLTQDRLDAGKTYAKYTKALNQLDLPFSSKIIQERRLSASAGSGLAITRDLEIDYHGTNLSSDVINAATNSGFMVKYNWLEHGVYAQTSQKSVALCLTNEDGVRVKVDAPIPPTNLNLTADSYGCSSE